MRFFGFDPNHIGAILQRSDAIKYAAVFAGAGTELEQIARQAFRAQQLAFALNHHIAVAQGFGTDFFAIQIRVIQVAQVARLVGDGDLFGEAGTQRVGTRHNHAVGYAQFHKGIAHGVDFGQEVGVGHGDFAVLVAALFFVGNLVFNLNTAGAGFNHLFGQQVSGFGIAKTGIDVGNNRHHMGFVIVDLGDDFGFFGTVAGFTGGIQGGEQQI